MSPARPGSGMLTGVRRPGGRIPGVAPRRFPLAWGQRGESSRRAPPGWSRRGPSHYSCGLQVQRRVGRSPSTALGRLTGLMTPTPQSGDPSRLRCMPRFAADSRGRTGTCIYQGTRRRRGSTQSAGSRLQLPDEVFVRAEVGGHRSERRSPLSTGVYGCSSAGGKRRPPATSAGGSMWRGAFGTRRA